MVPIWWPGNSKNIIKFVFFTNKSSISGLWLFHWILHKAPSRHLEGIFLMNHHHSPTKCKNFPSLIIWRDVFEGPSRIHWYLLSKMLTRSGNAAGDAARPLYQHRKNPYSWRLFGEKVTQHLSTQTLETMKICVWPHETIGFTFPTLLHFGRKVTPSGCNFGGFGH